MRRNRLYNDLAWLWQIWEDPEEYRQECELFVSLIHEHARGDARSLLDIGCGGGKNTFHLKGHFDVIGVDISEAMLAQAKELNPECTFCVGDMRNFDLGQQFDSVFMNDAIIYMTTREDLRKSFQTAYRHLKPGGVMLTYAERTSESFLQNQVTIRTSKKGDTEVIFLENNYDPDPDDEQTETVFIFLIREKGRLRIEHDLHVVGLFSLATWRNLLREAGFEAHEQHRLVGNQVLPVFVCIKL